MWYDIDMKYRSLFEDSDVLVLDKPSGVTVNKADTTSGEVTVQDWVEEYLGLRPYEKNSYHVDPYDAQAVFRSRAGIAHRIDKETSGILLVAKTVDAFVNLQKQFKDRTVEKKYTALAHGVIKPENGEINAPIGRLPWNRMRFGVIREGREALTFYNVLKTFSYPSEIQAAGSGLEKKMLSLVEIMPKTGRTHQIRVHLKHIGHPIFADSLYAGRKTARDDRRFLNRLFLHASEITFIHPKTQEKMVIKAELPEELKKIINTV